MRGDAAWSVETFAGWAGARLASYGSKDTKLVRELIFLTVKQRNRVFKKLAVSAEVVVALRRNIKRLQQNDTQSRYRQKKANARKKVAHGDANPSGGGGMQSETRSPPESGGLGRTTLVDPEANANAAVAVAVAQHHHPQFHGALPVLQMGTPMPSAQLVPAHVVHSRLLADSAVEESDGGWSPMSNASSDRSPNASGEQLGDVDLEGDRALDDLANQVPATCGDPSFDGYQSFA
jgi:hypothetical protein